MNSIKTVCLIGAGNVATHLGRAVRSSGMQVRQVYSKTFEKAGILAEEFSCSATNDLKMLDTSVDAWFVLVNDAMMMEVLEEIEAKDTLLIHSSGSVGMEVLSRFSQNYGVVYPLQTFSAQRHIDFNSLPLCIEANNELNLEKVREFGSSLSSKVYDIDSGHRLILHIAAVFACNFSNYMYAVAEELMSRYKLDFDLIRPLIHETAAKAADMQPSRVQTGPAFRNDQAIIDKHLELLKEDPKIREVYSLISRLIQERHELFKHLNPQLKG